jgi:uncharacterized membrane protein
MLMMDSKRILWITRTAIFIALLIAVQAVTKPLGQYVTGSCVNFILISSCMLLGLPSAAVVACVSPIMAFLILGTPIFPILIPFMIAGNLTIVAAIHFLAGKVFEKHNSYIRFSAAAVSASVLKFLVLWIGIVKIGLTLVPDIKPPQVQALSATFSWPQLVTALIGSGLAVAAAPYLKRALRIAERGE